MSYSDLGNKTRSERLVKFKILTKNLSIPRQKPPCSRGVLNAFK